MRLEPVFDVSPVRRCRTRDPFEGCGIRGAGWLRARDASRVLSSAGYRVSDVSDLVQFRDELPSASCAVVVAYELASELIPRRLDGEYVPPIVLISPLPLEGATRPLMDPRIVYKLLHPAPSDRLLAGAVTEAVITDILRRLADAVARYPGMSEALREGIRHAVNDGKRRVGSLSRSLDVSRRTLDQHWLYSFGPGAPKLKDFCRGVWLLRILRVAAAGEPVLVWSHLHSRLEISPSTLRRTSVAFTGHLPSELDLVGDPAAVLARVCERAIPSQLLHAAIRADVPRSWNLRFPC